MRAIHVFKPSLTDTMCFMTPFVDTLKDIQALLNKQSITNPVFLQVQGVFNKHMSDIDDKTREEILEMLRAFACLLRDMSQETKKSRNIYTRVMFFVGTLVEFGVDNLKDDTDNEYKMYLVLRTLFRTIGNFLVNDTDYYDSYSDRWNQEKAFLKQIGCIVNQHLQDKWETSPDAHHNNKNNVHSSHKKQHPHYKQHQHSQHFSHTQHASTEY